MTSEAAALTSSLALDVETERLSAAPLPSPAEDPGLLALAAEPVVVHQPAIFSAPFIFASPHSGRCYPQSFTGLARLDAINLRRSEDAFVDELFDCVTEFGAPLIAARFPRAFVDPNRAPAELDPAMFDAPLGRPVAARPPRTPCFGSTDSIGPITRRCANLLRRRRPNSASRSSSTAPPCRRLPTR